MSKIESKNLLDEKGVVNYSEAIELAYQILRKKCSLDDMSSKIESKGKYRLTILDVNELTTAKDTIYITLNNGGQLKFLISKFLQGKRLKYDMIKYYSEMNIYVRGPYILKYGIDSGTEQKESWVIDFSFFKAKTVLQRPDTGETQESPVEFIQPDEGETQESIVDSYQSNGGENKVSPVEFYQDDNDDFFNIKPDIKDV